MHSRDQQKFLSSRKIIRYMFFIRGQKSCKSTSVKISLLTMSGEYVEYSTCFLQKKMTPFVINKIKSLFSEYLLVHDSEILISDGISNEDPIYVYLAMIRQHVNFSLSTKDANDLLKRICRYHHNITKNPLFSVGKHYLNKIWAFMIKRKKCPWITEQIDCQLQKVKARYVQREIMLMRLGMYYMFIRKKYRDINNRAKAKKTAMQKIANNS